MQIFLAWETYHQRRTAASPDTSPFLVPVGESPSRSTQSLSRPPRNTAVACLLASCPTFCQRDILLAKARRVFLCGGIQEWSYEVWPLCFTKQQSWLQGVSRCYWVMYETVSASLRLWLWMTIRCYLKQMLCDVTERKQVKMLSYSTTMSWHHICDAYVC